MDGRKPLSIGSRKKRYHAMDAGAVSYTHLDVYKRQHELAETIGMDAFRRLVDVYGGTGRVYIPQADTLLIPIRDRLIREEYNRCV